MNKNIVTQIIGAIEHSSIFWDQAEGIW